MGDNDTDTRNYRKILYWFLSPLFQLELCPVWGWGQQRAPHCHSWPRVPWVSGKHRVGGPRWNSGLDGPPLPPCIP